MNTEIAGIEEELRAHCENEKCKSVEDYLRVFAALIYQERQKNSILTERIIKLELRHDPVDHPPIGPTVAGASQ